MYSITARSIISEFKLIKYYIFEQLHAGIALFIRFIFGLILILNEISLNEGFHFSQLRITLLRLMYITVFF